MESSASVKSKVLKYNQASQDLGDVTNLIKKENNGIGVAVTLFDYKAGVVGQI